MAPEAYLAIPLAVFAGWVAWLFFQRAREVLALERERLSTIGRMIDKFPSADSFLEFVHSSAGRALFATVDRNRAALRTVLRFVQMGIVVAAIGLALLWSAGSLKGATDAHSLQQMDERSYLGVSFLGLGAGLLGAGALSYLLARRFEMLDGSRKSH